MVDLNHVFKCRAAEKDLPAVHDVAGLTKISSQSFVKVGIINFLPLGIALMVLRISLKQVGFEYWKIVFQTSFSAFKWSTSNLAGWISLGLPK